MKIKIIFFLLALTIGICKAETVMVGDLYYNINSKDQTASVTMSPNRYEGLTSIEIPSSIEYNGMEFSVISIGTQSFGHCKSLTKVLIGNSVMAIDFGAFEYCSNLTTLDIGDSVVSIGERAFYQCESLSNVVMGKSVVSIGKEAFSSCMSLTDIEIGTSLSSIGHEAFASCHHLKSISLTTNLISIGDRVFAQCYELRKFNLNIIELNSYLQSGWIWQTILQGLNYYNEENPETDFNTKFDVEYSYNGMPIRNLTIPMGICEIVDYAFYKGININSVSFPDDISKIGAHSFEGTGISRVQLPESLETLGSGSFKNCLSLYSVVLPDNISNIESRSFAGCTALYEVKLPERITTLSDNLFKGCNDLEIVTLPSELREIGNGAFSDCRLASISLPQSLEKIGNEAFAANPFTEFNFPANLKIIGDKALYDCGLVFNKLSFNEGLVSIGNEAFSGDYRWYSNIDKRCNIKSISLPSTLEFIGSDAFNGSTFTEVTIPSAMTVISKGAFAGCEKLQKVTFHDNVEAIGPSAFDNTGIINITFPEKLTSIGASAFANSKISFFSIPNSVTSIGENAFPSLRYLKLGAGFNNFSVKFCRSTQILELIETTPPALTTDRLWFEPKMVLVPEGSGEAYKENTRWKDYNIIAKNSGRAEVYLTEPGTLAMEIRLQSGLMPGAVTNLSVEGPLNNEDFAIMRSNMEACYDIDLSKANITAIPAEAFKDKIGLLDLVLPNSIATIGKSAFLNCYLMRTNIPQSLTSIGSSAFKNCESLDNEIVFSPSMSNIGAEAFQDCWNIKSVDMSAAKDISIDVRVFENCYGLTNVTLPSELSFIPYSAFENSNITFIEIPSTASIRGRAFYNCSSLREVVFKPGISTIGEYAFSNSGLTYVSIPSSIKSIPSNCFQGSGIVYANLAGTTQIASNAFADCSSLIVINLPSTLESVSEGSFNSPSLTAINSPSVKPAVTYGNPVADVSRNECALSIPKPSFSSYLAAEYWGGFVNIRNCIDITEESIDASGNIIPSDEDTGIELTYMAEEDYQEMLEDMEQEEENVEQPKNARRNALRIMRTNGLADVNKGYGKLFNNASLFLDEHASTRFFISLADDVTSFSVTYNGKDITHQIDPNTMSFVIDGLKSNGNLIISTNGHVNGIRDVIADKNIEDESGPYYNLNGQIVKNPTPGIYIRNGKKIIVR